MIGGLEKLNEGNEQRVVEPDRYLLKATNRPCEKGNWKRQECTPEPRKTAQQLRTSTILPEDPTWFPPIHQEAYNRLLN